MSASEISEQSSTQACESVSSFDFTGTGMDLFILYMKNFILTLITFGLYFPWAKTKIRKFTLSHIKLQDDYFEFTGTGKEVFFGLLKLFGFFLFFLVVMMLFHLGMLLIFGQFLSQENSVKFGVPFMTIFQFTVMFFCTPFLILGSVRYFLSRIKYRNILFTLEPIDVKKLFKAWSVTLLKLILTGGLYSYVLPNYFFNIFVNSVSYGGKKFSYTGLNQDFFFNVVIKNLIFTILSCGLYAPWTLINILKFQIEHITFDGHRLSFNPGRWCVVILFVNSFLLPILTFGLAFPFARASYLKTLFSHIKIHGDLDLSTVHSVSFEKSDSAFEKISAGFESVLI